MANRYSPEVRARAVRMVFEHQGSYETQAGAIAAIAPKIGCIPQTLSGWVKQAEKDSGMRDGVTTEERDRIETLERENHALANVVQGNFISSQPCATSTSIHVLSGT